MYVLLLYKTLNEALVEAGDAAMNTNRSNCLMVSDKAEVKKWIE